MSPVLKIILHPDPGLRVKSREISAKEIATPEIQKLLRAMEATMISKDGAGLAAPQVGQPIRLAVIGREQGTIFMINPQITKKSWARETEEEGCLSILNDAGEILYAPVERHKKVNCVYLNIQGKKCRIQAEKMAARVIQHEIDHLDGILFIDRLKEGDKKKLHTLVTDKKSG